MSDFDYSQHSTDVLVSALKEENSYIARKKAECRRLAKRIKKARGYSHRALAIMSENLKTYERMVEMAREEAAELESVIAQRAA